MLLNGNLSEFIYGEGMNIEVKNLKKTFGQKVIFDNFNIEIKENKVNCILGKSGCGKSTFLNILCQSISKDYGTINGIDNKSISYIFQEDRLIEWLTVEENINMILKKKYAGQELKFICKKYLSMVGMDKEIKNYPNKLSGGMRQRINIARAFAYPSKLVLMDEPFKSLDIKNKFLIMKNLKDILKKENRTVIFVTHDIDEALYLGDIIYVFGDKPTKVLGRFEDVKDKEFIISMI